MASKASAVWTGSLKEGKGTISTATGVLKDANYSFATRFEGASSGTTPEELIAAAHASCFSMALGAQLGGAGLTPTKIETEAAVTLAKVDDSFKITKIALTTTASVPGATTYLQVQQDLQIGEEGEITFRTKLRLSFKYEDEDD